MIIAAILRNYKCYKGIHCISFVPSVPQKMNVIIGDNGTGKSSILEALDSFFNDAPWIINTSSNKDDVSVGVVFWVKKTRLKRALSSSEIALLENLSDAYWNIDISANSNFGKYYQSFFYLREKLLYSKEDHYLFIIGKKYLIKEYSNLSFEQSVKSYLSNCDIKWATVGKLYQSIINTFSYLYIPVETSVSDFLRLETRGMQTLMNRDIKDNISAKLNEKTITQRKGNLKRTKRLSLLDIINIQLEEFVDEVQNDIQQINKEYNFKPLYKQSVKLTANHVADTIIESYYKKRSLKKGEKPISTLSSGEKRMALIDIMYVFLSKHLDNDKELIVAVDEPENSLHISKCYSQFNRLNEISLNYNKQIFVTTHWYGSLPIINKGTLLHLNDMSFSQGYDLSNYFEQRRELPDDILLKGYFDLASSILSAYRNNKTNWLLVEGKEDKKYIEYYIDVNALNLIVMPLGGCANVKKVYEYLYVPMSSAKDGFDDYAQKILCLVDTDEQCVGLNVQSDTKNKSLMIRRLNENASHIIEFKKIDDPNRTPTEIEDILIGSQFYEALKQAIFTEADSSVQDAFNSFDLDGSVDGSRVRGDYSILNHKGQGRNIRMDKELIVGFINDHKDLISDIYTHLPTNGMIPQWVSWITDCFTKK